MTPLRLCLVGAGPRSLGVLDRLGSLASHDPRPVVVHVIDPYPPGSGRIWREDQHPLLWMNSRAADVTVLPDATSLLPQPVRHGPTLYAWLDEHRAELARDFAATGRSALRAEVLAVQEGTFVSRALGSHYLRWAWRDVVAALPPHVTVHEHPTRVADILDARSGAGTRDGAQVVHLDDGDPLLVDAVLLAQGHPDVSPGPSERARTQFADRHGLGYLAPAYTSDLGIDTDLDTLLPGEDVIVAGMGLAFVDLVVLVTEGRGGRFVFQPAPDGSTTLRYEPSGAEPVLHVGSRRGVPYRSKITYALRPRPQLPRFLTVETATARGGDLDLHTDVWPLIAKELAGAHYAELFRSHPERTRTSWAEFESVLVPAVWGSAELDDLIARSVPDVADRLDLDRLDRPLKGWWAECGDEVHARVRDHIEADVTRRGDPAHSPDAAVFFALLSCYVTVAGLARRGLLTASSAAVEVDGWWHGFFSYLASGPPPQRLRQLLALADAGVVRFLGGDLVVEPDEVRGTWTARVGNTSSEVSARVLVEARLPDPSIRNSADPLLRRLSARGEVREEGFTTPDGTELSNGRLVVDAEHRLVMTGGSAHPRRFAAGPWVAGNGWAAAFARPGLDAGFFRLNDRLAAGLLGADSPTATVRVIAPRTMGNTRSAPTPPVR
ncbi:MAG: FAD/NAD(P)-binding protein [Janthinobacterium lividum]